MKALCLGFDDPAYQEKASLLAQRLNLEIDSNAENQLLLTSGRLMLKIFPFLPMAPNFEASFWLQRRNEGKKQGLVRACKPYKGLRILDATAGWGRDAAILASFGAEVLMMERNPIMAALLEDALSNVKMNQEADLKLHLVFGNAMDYLQRLSPELYPDVIYIDPMHPLREKTALVKKDLQILQQLIGPDEDARGLIECARKKALQRVVVKWPQKQPSLLPVPHATVPGKTVRFDIYTPTL